MSESPEPLADTQPDSGRRELVKWLWRLPVIGVLVGGTFGLYEVYQTQFRKRRPSSAPIFIDEGRERVAPLSDLSEPWSNVGFTYANTPAYAIRLSEPVPGGLSVNGAHYAAYSRVCTHLGCIVNYTDNLELLSVSYNHRTQTPALACRCHFSVFVPQESGRAVSGPATEPLPRVRLEVEGDTLYATGLEQLPES